MIASRRWIILATMLVAFGIIGFAILRATAGPKLSWMDRMVAQMDQTANVTIQFEGIIVNESGQPIPDASVDVLMRGIDVNWASDPRGSNARDWDRQHRFKSAQDGRISFEVEGTSFSVSSIGVPGYQWLFEKGRYTEDRSNASYRIAPAGTNYIPQQGSPAIFVMVSDGVTDVHVMPSRGGAEVDSNGRIIPNQPRWPRKPSLPNVIYKPPSTRPNSG